MKTTPITILIFLSAFFFSVAVEAETFHVGGPVVLYPSSGAASIQNAIDALPASGGTIRIHAGEYALTHGIHINRSNVTLSGESGTVLKLADGVNEPVLLIGTDVESPGQTDPIGDIRVYDIEIDGNKENQDSETDPGRPWIRNNGIDVRRVRNLWIANVNVHDAVSGGLVVSWNSGSVFVENSTFRSNAYDGIALYASEDIQISDFLCADNTSAGLSLDNGLEDVVFNSGIVKNNADVGIFARNSKDIRFHNLSITQNGSHGSFISHENPGTGTGVTRLFFSSCAFVENGGDGLHLGSTTSDSPDNAVSGCLFSGNAGTAIFVVGGGSIDEAGNIYQPGI